MATGIRVFFVVLLGIWLADNADSHPDLSSNIVQNITVNEDNNGVNKTPIFKKKHHLYFIPFARPLHADNDNNSDSCATNGDEDDFPPFFTNEQVKHGGIVLVIFIGIYGFALLACVCNDYFLPCVETICEKLNLTPDVAAATFMSIATSTPEFFTNIIGTFITESDLGIGTIVGSSLYNALGVPAVGGLCSPFALRLDWYPLTRDCLIYVVAVSVLILITWDGVIYWYETLIPLAVYIVYFIIMFNNKRISKKIRKWVGKEQKEVTVDAENSKGNEVEKKRSTVVDEEEQPRGSIMSAYGTYMEAEDKPNYETEHHKVLEAIQEDDKKEAMKSLFRWPEGNWFKKCIFYYTWPIYFCLRYTIPHPKVYPNWYPLSFFMCIIWLGFNSYVISWMISLIGGITQLPDALLGMTLMAVGGCLPETVSMTIIARRGEGAFGVSNSLGANTMNVLYSLGLPWLMKNIINGLTTARPIRIQSGSIEYTIMSLIVAVGSLYIVMVISKFKLSKISGLVLGCTYIALVVLAVLSQTVFFKTNSC